MSFLLIIAFCSLFNSCHTLLFQSDLNLYDSIVISNTTNNLSLVGNWGEDEETGNCIMAISDDSIYFVDPAITCSYIINGNKIIIRLSNNDIYLEGLYEIYHDTLFINAPEYTLKYARYNGSVNSSTNVNQN